MSALHCFECGGNCPPYHCDRARDPRDDMQPQISHGWAAMGPTSHRKRQPRRRWWWTR